MDLFTAFEARRWQAPLRRTVESGDSGTALLRQQLQLAMLAVETLSEILYQRLGITQEELLEKMEEIDLRDGKHDGRLAAGVVSCPHCDRPNARQSLQCVYCGFDPLPISRLARSRDAEESSISSNDELRTIESSRV